ncbi:Right handed beta helix region [Lachnospiraceae bacterium C7]|nr:Right handed beta helix region [Lachnospiraceae bacterium C7]
MFKKFKKAITFLALTCLLTGLFTSIEGVNTYASSSSTSWNFGDMSYRNFKNITSPVTVNNMTLIANGSKKNMQVCKESVNIAGISYSYALATEGSGSLSYRALRLPVYGASTIKVVAKSNGSDTRALIVTNSKGKQIGSMNATAYGNLSTYSYTGSKGYIYLYSSNSDIHIFKVQIDSKNSTVNPIPSKKDDSSKVQPKKEDSKQDDVNKDTSKDVTPTISGNTITVKAGMSLENTVKKAKAGTTIIIDGTIKSGTIKLPAGVNISGIHNATIDFSATSGGNGKGFSLAGNGSTLSNITVKNAADNGVYITGNNNILKNVVCCYNHDAGFQVCNGGAYNKFYNCTAHHNADATGENADGFAVKLHSGVGNYFEDCVAESNSDDGWDCYAAHGAVTLINCHANYNGLCNGIRGDGNGFKMGGIDNKTPGQKAHLVPVNHYLEGCSAVGNYSAGFDRNNQSGVVTMKNCYADSNKDGNYHWPATGKPSALGYKVTFGKAIIDSCTSKNGSNDISGAILKGNCVGFNK